MKKILLLIIIILALLITSVYLFIPRIAVISNIEKFNCNINNVNRYLMNGNKWAKWWPGAVNPNTSNKDEYDYNGYKYVVREYKYSSIDIQTNTKNSFINGSIYFIPLNVDTVQVEWKYSLEMTSNPINRIYLFLKAKKLERDIKTIMKSMKVFLENQVNIYGVKFYETMSNDSALIVTKYTTNNYPSAGDIYNLISQLKKYIVSHGAKENNFPMLNVKKLNESEFETMVAIPINKVLPGNGKIFFRRFVPWKVLAAEVRGGSYTVEEAMKEMKVYMNDYHKRAMALPFQSLVTDRSKQPDTLQWISIIYTPIP